MSNKKRRGNSLEQNRLKRLKKNEVCFDDIIENLKNPHGSERSAEENKLLIQSMAYFQKNGMSLNEAANECQKMFKGCNNTYLALWNYFVETGEVDISQTHSKRGSEHYKMLEIWDMDDKIDSFLQFAFDYTVSNNIGFSINDLISFLNDEHVIILDM